LRAFSKGNVDPNRLKKFHMTTKFAQVLVGPAGSGKSTYIKTAFDYYTNLHRTVHCVNLDPAAEYLPYEPHVDIRATISVTDVMKRYKFGPNGALICCLELVASEASEWFDDAIGEHEYDYLLIDLPGQIELYSHLTVLSDLLKLLQVKGYNLLVVFCVDAQFVSDPGKFLSGALVALSTMTMLELPHINVITKCDLLTEDDQQKIDWFTDMETSALAELIKPGAPIEKLTEKICEVFDLYHLVQFQTLRITDPDNVARLLSEIDNILQYYESADYGDPEFDHDSDNED
jgi:GTPase SAR1 family protein